MADDGVLSADDRGSRAWWARIAPRAAAALIVLAVMALIANVLAAGAVQHRVAIENRVVLGLERVLSRARDIETGGRGYVIVGSDEYLQPYRAAIAAIPGDERFTRDAWADAGGAPDRIAPLFEIVREKATFTERYVETRRSAGLEPALALVASGEGRALMDGLRTAVGQLQATRVAERDAVERSARIRSAILTSLTTFLVLAAFSMLAWLAWHRRRMAQKTSVELAGLGDRFGTLADNIPQLAWMADATGEIFWYNQRWYDYTGLTAADMGRVGWRQVHDPSLVQGVSQRFMTAITTGERWQDTFPLRRHDGEYRWFLSLALPIRDGAGTIQRWFGTNTDVTEQRQQEQELAAARDAAEEANRAKSQFLANMSHELRTPLSAVIGYSEMLEEEVEELGEPSLAEDLAKIKSNARHLLSLINDVLDISKIEANKMELFAETFDVAAMIKDVAATVSGLVEKKGNRLDVEMADGLGAMHSDIVKIRQVLINLLSNAAKFTENGTIALKARRETRGLRDDLVFSVVDSGLGMSEEQVGRLFRRFTQADASTTRRFGGTGLGLAITKAFSDMLGGGVTVESRPEQGSTFTVTIPARLLDPAEATGVDAVVEATTIDEDVILVIDDDAATRDLLTRFLTRESFTVRSAVDGVSGLALAQALKPKVILLDVTMPRMDGWEVLRKLKDDPHLSAIPVVMCTIIDEQNLGFSLGASDYILKPVDWERLREVLSRIEVETPKGDVLIVDDDPAVRDRLRVLMAKQGWTVSEAENGRVALEAVRARVPALVLLDLTMPEMDGFTFLREFRSTPDWTGVPVIVMTARDLTAGERAELKGGGAKVLAKGLTGMQDLLTHIRALPGPEATRQAGPIDMQAAPAARQAEQVGP